MSTASITAGATAIPNARDIYALAWPMTVKSVMLFGIVVIDTLLVAPLGEAAIAAMGIATAIGGIVLGVLGAFASATQIRLAQGAGAGDRVFLKSAFLAGTALNVAVALASLALVWLASGALIKGLAHDGWIAEQASRYLAIFSIVILGEAVGTCLSSYFNGSGETRLPLYAYAVGVPVNVAASYALIHGVGGAPELGVAGAAVGSAVATLLQLAILTAAMQRRTGWFADVSRWHEGSLGAAVRGHLRFSAPIAATFVSATLSINVCKLLYARMSVTEFAALSIITPWIQVAGTIGMSWAQATGIVVAQMLGRGRSAAALDAFVGLAWRTSFLAAAIVAMVYGLVCLWSPVVYPDLDARTHATLLSFLVVLLVLPFPKQSNAICGNTLRAGGETVPVMHIFVWSQWAFRVPATAVLVLWLDVPASWVLSLLLLEEFVKFPFFHGRLRRGDWKRGGMVSTSIPTPQTTNGTGGPA